MVYVRHHAYRWLSLTLLAVTAASAEAAENYLQLIPNTALAWGAVNHMKDAGEKIQKLAMIVSAPANLNVYDEIKRDSGLQKGLDEKGAAGFFVLPGKTERDSSTGAFFVAVTSEKEFLANYEVEKADEKINEVKVTSNRFGNNVTRKYCVAFLHGYAVLATAGDRAAVEAAVASTQGLAAEMAGLESWLSENDGNVVATPAGIKYAAKQAKEELRNAKDEVAQVPALRTIVDVYGKALEAAPAEISLAMAGIRSDKQGSIRIIGRARLIGGGLVSNALAGTPAVKEKFLSGVPGGPFVVAAGGVNVAKLLEGYMQLTLELMKGMPSIYKISGDDLQRIGKESFEAFRQVHSLSFVMKTGKRGDPIYGNTFFAMHVDSSQQFLDLVEKYGKSANKILQDAKQTMLKLITVKRLEIAGKSAIQLEVEVDPAGLAVSEASRPMFEEMMGVGNKMLMYCVAADEHTLLMGAGISQERMAAVLDAVKQPRKSLAEDADVSVTAAMLPEKSQWVAYLNLRGYVQLTQRIMAVMLKSQPQAMTFSLPSFPKSPPIGLAVLARADELYAEVAFPAGLIQAAGDYAKEMQNMFMNPGGAPNPTPVP
jgi:hypothetical protein